MSNVNIFARVVEVQLTSSAEEYKAYLAEGWVQLGILIVPPKLSALIPDLKPSHLNYAVAIGRLQDEPRVPSTEETFAEPRPSEINAKLTEGWTLVSIDITTTTAFTGSHGIDFASYFIVQR